MIQQTMYDLGAHRSCIRELFEYGRMRAAQVGAENVFDFSLGNPSIPAPEQVSTTIAHLVAQTEPTALHGYTPAVGDAEARRSIAEDLNRRYDAGVRPEDLFLGCGAAPELVSVIRALAVPGAEFIAIAPYFPEYKPFVTGCGGIFRSVPAQIPDFGIDLAALESAITPHTQAVIVNSPNNPSGAVYRQETLERLADLLTRKSREVGHPIYIIADEPYRELVYGGIQVPFLPKLYPDTVVCYSYSKSLSLPGERIGYVYVPRQAQEHDALYAAICGAARVSGHVCAPSLWQKVIAQCAHLRPDLAQYDHNRRLLWQGLTAMGYETARPDGAFYLFVKAPNGSAKAFSELAKKQDVLVVPGDDFGCPEYFRLCYCVSADCIQRSLPRFQALMDQIKSTK